MKWMGNRATTGTRAELDTRARFSGTRAMPRKRVNGKAAARISLINTRPLLYFSFFHRRSDSVETIFFLLFFALHRYFQGKTRAVSWLAKKFAH